MGKSDTRMWIRMNENPKENISFEIKTREQTSFHTIQIWSSSEIKSE